MPDVSDAAFAVPPGSDAVELLFVIMGGMMNEQQVEKDEATEAVEKRQEPQQNWRRQTMGSVIGGAAGLLLAMGLRMLNVGGENLLPFILWGAVLGSMLSGIEALERAGQRITRRDVRWLNVAVAIMGMIIIFAFIFGLMHGLTLVMRQVLPR